MQYVILFCSVFFSLDTLHQDEQKWIPAALSCSFNCIFSSFKWLAVNCTSIVDILQLLAHFKALINGLQMLSGTKTRKCQDLLVTMPAPTEVTNNKVQITLETENVSFTVHQFVCMPNCLCLFVVPGVIWATFAALTWELMSRSCSFVFFCKFLMQYFLNVW